MELYHKFALRERLSHRDDDLVSSIYLFCGFTFDSYEHAFTAAALGLHSLTTDEKYVTVFDRWLNG